MKIKISVFLAISMFFFVKVAYADMPVVVPSHPLEGDVYYTDENLPVTWPEIDFEGNLSFSLRTEAQASLSPSAGGALSASLPSGATSHVINLISMSLLSPRKYKVIIACGQELCAESGYFDIKIRPAVLPIDDNAFIPSTEGGDVGGADQNVNPGGFVPETDGGNTGGADQNTNLGDFVPDTDGGNTGGADIGSSDQNNEQNQQAAAQESFGSSGETSGSSKKPVALALVAASNLPTLTDIESCIYIKDYLNIRGSNNSTEVTKLQTFLLNTEGIDVPVNGIFDQATSDAVKAFQTKYLDDVMTPWGLKVASGIVSYTTKKKINEIYCKTTFSLTPEQLAAIESYKNRQTAVPVVAPETFVVPDNVEVGFVQPESSEIQETPVVAEQATETPVTQQTQTASALDAGGGFFQKIINFFKKIF